MISQIIENQVFERIDYSGNDIAKREIDSCKFVDCNFYNSDLSGTTFTECEFNNCNFSMAKIRNSAFKDVKFQYCKLLGLNFNECNKFLMLLDFEDCHLDLASFAKLKLKNTRFKNCSLQEVDFSDTDLSNSVFDNCDFSRAIFGNTILEKADLRTSRNYVIDPEDNRMKKAKFSIPGVLGLLIKYNIVVD
jgi:fluoroquinolone resistance protein